LCSDGVTRQHQTERYNLNNSSHFAAHQVKKLSLNGVLKFIGGNSGQLALFERRLPWCVPHTKKKMGFKLPTIHKLSGIVVATDFPD
jgi:hypothetical protein